MTGMSGTGKSSALEGLRLLGFRTVDTDEGDWTEWSEAEGGYIWREEQIAELLADDEGPFLVRLWDGLQPGPLLPPLRRHRPAQRSGEHSPQPHRDAHDQPLWADRRATGAVLRDLAEAEPLIRRTCTHEIDATQPLADVVTQLAELSRDPSA